MTQKINCIMLVDDNEDDNYYHEKVIQKSNLAGQVVTKTSCVAALEYLRTSFATAAHPDLILLDINMPGMNGWEFLKEYNSISSEYQSKVVVVMLSTSDNHDDVNKSLQLAADFKTKPLTKGMLEEIIDQFF